MKHLLLSLALLLVARAACADEERTYDGGSMENWSAEASFQTQSVAGDSSPLFGPALLVELTHRDSLGFRALAPFNKTVDVGAYAFQGFWRHFFSSRRTNLFMEASGAFNIVRNNRFASTGFAFGVIRNLDWDLAVGGMAGIEFARRTINSSGVKESHRLSGYPKASLFVALDF